jgi:hypothetical protein
VAVEAAVPDQDSVWVAASPVVQELERAAPEEVAQARADQARAGQAEELVVLAAPEAEVAAELMPEICGVHRGREAVVAVAQALEPVEVLVEAQVARVDPEGVAAALVVSALEEVALPEEARERALQAAALVVEVASEVAARVAQLEALPDPAETQANG